MKNIFQNFKKFLKIKSVFLIKLRFSVFEKISKKIKSEKFFVQDRAIFFFRGNGSALVAQWVF